MSKPYSVGDFKPPTIKNTKDVSKLDTLENFLYTPSEIAIVRKNVINKQKKAFEYQYNQTFKDALKKSALAFSIPVLLSLYVDKKGYSAKKSTFIIVSPLILSAGLYFIAPKWS